MEELDLRTQFPADFSGIVRLFPLPDLVLFPGVVQPLHLFERRYLELLQDALRDDQLITMALLEPGWEADYEGRPPIAPVTCIGRIMGHRETDKGRYNVFLLGLRRAAVTRELPPTHSYRTARVEFLDDVYQAGAEQQRTTLRHNLLETCRQFIGTKSAALPQFDQLLNSQIPLGRLADVLAYATRLPVATKQELLTQCHVEQRARRLLAALQRLAASANEAADANKAADAGKAQHDDRQFPPRFSDN